MKNQATKRERVGGKVLSVSNPNTVKGQDVTLQLLDTRAERAVIGAVLQKPDLYPSLCEIVQAGDFLLLQYGYIWYAFDQLFSERKTIDLFTVSDKLEALGQYPLKGEALDQELVSLVQSSPDVTNAEVYARKVFETSLRCRLIKAANEMREMAVDKQVNVDELVDQCDWKLYGATNRLAESKTSVKDIMSAYFDKVDEMRESGTSQGILSYFQELDDKTCGFTPGEVTVLAGGEGMGKTTVALSSIRNMLKRGIKVALFTLEMTQEEIIRLLTAMEAGIYKDALKTFKLSDYQWSLFVRTAPEIQKWPLHVVDEFPTLSPVQLRRKLRRLMMDEDIQLVAIDGLWLMEANDPTKERFRDVSNIMRDLNQVARDFEVPILITHQYKEDFKNAKRPTIYHLAESAGVRRNAQVVWGLKQIKDSDGNRHAELYILKDRNGRSQGEKVQLIYNREHSRYEGVGHVDESGE